MKKIVPFKKEIILDDQIEEITSISLEHTLNSEGYLVSGNFNLCGDYRKENQDIQEFNYDLPFVVNIDEKYNVDNMVIDIDDFYYEVIDNKVLKVNIDVLLDNLEEIERCIEEESNVEEKEEKLEETIVTKEEYQGYLVYIFREGDSVETILNKYEIDRESLENYNDLSSLKTGDKIIIPCDK